MNVDEAGAFLAAVEAAHEALVVLCARAHDARESGFLATQVETLALTELLDEAGHISDRLLDTSREALASARRYTAS
jgi:hypothetical protein